MMIPFVKSCYLDWHYRSRDEALMNFSNHYIYQNRLDHFSLVRVARPVIKHELTKQELGIDGEEGSCMRLR